jgi:hypothetical protein
LTLAFPLPATFTRLAAVIGIGFFLIGLVAAVTPDAAAAGALAGLQAFWILAASITALRSSRSRRLPPDSRAAETQFAI